MKHIFFCCFFLISTICISQDAQLARQYFSKGEYEKAIVYYKKLYDKQQQNTLHFKKLISCHQQLQQLKESESLILAQQKRYPKHDYLWVELGYNYQLSKQSELATANYKKAIAIIDVKPKVGPSIAGTFKINFLYDYALEAYKKILSHKSNPSYFLQIASIYGEMSDIENMFNSYLNLIEHDPRYISTSLRQMGRYTTDDSQNKYNLMLKKAILKRSVSNPSDSWNQLLSWLFMQQKDYNKAFVQEKALYVRSEIDLKRIKDLGVLSFQNKQYDTAKKCYSFVLENTQNQVEIINAKLYLLKIASEINPNLEEVDAQFQEQFSLYGKGAQTYSIQIAYADFLTFKKDDPEKAIALLKETLKGKLNSFQEGAVKIQLGDALVYTNKYNKALLYYSQVQTKLRNHMLAQQARYKVAQTSYFKGDFKWAQTQLKVLKGSTSQLISNDAIDLSMLIGDNTAGDTIQIALKEYAKADLLAYQNKNKEAVSVLDSILKNHKGHAVEDEVLFKQAKLFEKMKQFETAENNYLQIIAINKEDILVDDAHYFLAELYATHLDNEAKASEYYEKIIFEFPSSIHLVEARKKFRKIRGDVLN